jgi:hypothetical protein
MFSDPLPFDLELLCPRLHLIPFPLIEVVLSVLDLLDIDVLSIRVHRCAPMGAELRASEGEKDHAGDGGSSDEVVFPFEVGEVPLGRD